PPIALRIRPRPLLAPLLACHGVEHEALRALGLVRMPPGARLLRGVREQVGASGLAERQRGELGGDLFTERLIVVVPHARHSSGARHDRRSTAIASRATSGDTSRPSSSSYPPLATLARRRRIAARSRSWPSSITLPPTPPAASLPPRAAPCALLAAPRCPLAAASRRAARRTPPASSRRGGGPATADRKSVV